MPNNVGRPQIGDHKLTQTELNRRHQDKICSIDAEMSNAFKNINWARRNHAEQSLENWVQAYCVPLLLNDYPPELGKRVLQKMEYTITAHEKFMVCMGRGSGKTSYVECATLFAIATGKQKFVVIVAANQRSSSNILKDLWRAVNERDTAFSQDYPEISLPFHLANGSFRRRQLYRGIPTEIEKNASELVFARLKDEKGDEMPTSGSLISCRGVTGGIRGLKRGTLRPSYVILDDIMTTKDSRSPEAIEKLVETINKDIVPLAGKERLSILNCATPIAADDLVAKIKSDSSWKTLTFPAIINFPTNMGLWDEYFRLWDSENATGSQHTESLAYYDQHRKEMDEGVSVFNPTRYSERDGHRSMIQKLLELRHTLGDNAFLSEYQMEPVQVRYALPINPSLVASRVSPLRELEVPAENVQFVCASSDLNLSKYITTTIVVYLRDQTAVCIYRAFRKCNVPVNIPEQDYYQRVYNLLAEHGKELKALNIPNLHWVIDANGVPFNAVCDFCRNSRQACGLQAAGFIGKASTQFRSFLKSRLKEEVSRTLLCGNEDEHRLSGSGRKYTFWDSDLYREKVQKAFLQEVGNIGSLAWYTGGDHARYAVQVCGEKLVYKKDLPNGTTEYRWKSNGPDHDVLDSLAQSMACYASMGFSTGFSGRNASAPHRKFAVRSRPRVRII